MAGIASLHMDDNEATAPLHAGVACVQTAPDL